MMTQKKIFVKRIIIFFSFLKENNVYLKWKKNIGDIGIYISGMWDARRHMGNCVNYSFCWDDTPEHYDFWRKINDNWKNFYYKNIDTEPKLKKYLKEPTTKQI